MACLSAGEPSLVATIMPRPEDHTHMWWAEGFPGNIPSAPWLRCIQAGNHAMVLDTKAMRIPHWGTLPASQGYVADASADNSIWRNLPAADLELTITVNNRTWRCTAGKSWTKLAGPRLIASGRFLQQTDVTDLVFTADDGTRLNVEARFEMIAWPGRLGFILAARPGQQRNKGTTTQTVDVWTTAAMTVRLTAGTRTVQQRWELPQGERWNASTWHEVALAMDPAAVTAAPTMDAVTVQASELPSGKARTVRFDSAFGSHRIDIDGITSVIPAGGPERKHDAMERVKLVLANPTDREQLARLVFDKKSNFSVTGISAMLRDPDGHPTGIPVQLSKNWHGQPDSGTHYGQWFRGCTQVRLPPKTTVSLELTIVYGHWGGVAAASHAQLCLIGWGSNQLWDQSALGSWGESICFEPDRAQAACLITDVRPVMVRSMGDDGRFNWTHNVGGGDFFLLFNATKQRVFPSRIRTAYQSQGPCLTAVTYAGVLGNGIRHAATVSLGRTGDVVRGTWRLRLDVDKAMDFSRFVICQVGADTYSYGRERKLAIGNETGLVKEWGAQWGGDTYRTPPMACTGRIPWISLHDGASRAAQEKNKKGAWADRGLIIRSWRARLGGREASPWLMERGVRKGEAASSTVDLVPPPGITRLDAGDFVDAIIEHVVMPMAANDYHGPDEALRTALSRWGNTWRMIEREATGNDRQVTMTTGSLEGLHPAVAVRAQNGAAAWSLTGGIGHVPITITGLPAYRGWRLLCDDKPVNQSVHGNDFWQTDYDPSSRTWNLTWTVPATPGATRRFRLERTP
jgi:hypothetical protein